jgi:hypothetical protein
MAWIGQLRALIRQLIPATKRVDSLKSKFLGAVACPKTDVAELSISLD